MNLKKRFTDMIDDGMDVRPWLLFTLVMTIGLMSASAVFMQSISEGIDMSEAKLLRGGSVDLIGSLQVSPLLQQSLLSLGLLNLPLSTLEFAAVFQIMIAIVSLALLFELVRTYYNARYGFLSVLVLSTSAIYLSTVTLLGSIWLSFFILTGTILALLRLRRGHWSGYVSLPIVAGALIGFGTLGAALALLAIAAVFYTIRQDRLKRLNWPTVAGMATSFLLVAGGYWLLIAQIGTSQFVAQFDLPQLQVLLDNLLFHINGGANDLGWANNWPLWNIAYASMTGLGFAVALRRRQAQRYKLSLALSGVYLAGLTLPYNGISIALGSLVSVLLITAGVRYLIQSWETMLPRNRVRHLISGMMVVAILLIMANAALTRQFIIRPSTDYQDSQLPVDVSSDLYRQFRQTTPDTL